MVWGVRCRISFPFTSRTALLLVLWLGHAAVTANLFGQQSSGKSAEEPSAQATPSASLSVTQDVPPPSSNAASAANTSNGATPAESPVTPMADLVEKLRERLATAELEQPVRDKYLERLQVSAREIMAAQENLQNLIPLRTRMETLATEAERLRNLTADLNIPDVGETDTQQLETRQATLQVKLTEEQQKLTEFQRRAEEISSTKQTLQSQLGKLTADLAALPPAAGPPDVLTGPLDQALVSLEVAARRQRINSEQNLQQTRLALLDAEVSLGLPRLRTESQEKLIRELTRELGQITSELEIRRKAESTARLQQAQRDQAAITDPALRELVQRTTAIATLNNALVQEELPRWQNELKLRSQQLTQIREDGDKLKSRIERFGTSGAVGVELLRFREQLPGTAQFEALLDLIEEKQNSLEFERLDYREELADAEKKLQAMEEAEDANAANLWSSKVTTLRSVIANNTTLFTTLADLNAECRTLVNVIQASQDYVSVQAMWFPSHPMLSTSLLTDIQRELMTIGEGFWLEWTDPNARVSPSAWLGLLPAVFAFLLLFSLKRRIRESIAGCSERASKRACIAMEPTLRTALLTVALAAHWPLGPIAVGSLLCTQFSVVTESHVLGRALVMYGTLILLLNFLRQTLRSKGLADSHFGWDDSLCRFLRGWLHRLIVVLSVPTVIYLFLAGSPSHANVLLRLTFVTLMVLIVMLISRLLSPGKSVLSRQLLNPASGFQRLRWVLTATCLLFPVVLAVLSVVGYQYTAAALARRLVESIAVALILGVLYAISLRWLRVRGTRTALVRARERAAQREKVGADDVEPSEASDSTIPPTTQNEPDLEVLGIQARALIRNMMLIALASVLWGIWYEMLPALRVVSEYPLYQITQEVNVLVDDVSLDSVPQKRIQFQSITVGHLITAGLTAVITLWAVRLLPSLIEVILLSRVAVDTGIRYAVVTISRYIMLLTGVVIACQLIGLRWGNVQWLVAGLSVGLGFGLQEVFANFVSGLIILFERPIRIGDIVTIDEITGVVSRIRIRATFITDWDRREYIVPNREFVTGKLLNWTLSDTTNRFVLPVGIGYGCNTVRAREIMLEVAKEHPGTLDDPAPLATFEAFGESSLNLVLRVYMPTLDNRLATISDLHTEILRRFGEESIEIAFPQRDLHIISGKSVVSGKSLLIPDSRTPEE